MGDIFGDFINPFDGAWDPAGISRDDGPASGDYGETGMVAADPMDLFGNQAAQAADEAKAYGDEALQLQADWQQYIKEQYAPYSEVGIPALYEQATLSGLAGSEAQQASIDQITNDPLYRAKVAAGDESVMRNAAMTGGLRSGNVQSALATQNQALLSEEVDAQYQQLAGLSGQGFAGQSTETQYGTDTIDQMTTTLGTLASGEIASQAAQTENITGLAGIVGSFFSDERLKTNITKIGDKHGMPWYSWEWNKTAGERFNLSGPAVGHMATDVELNYPDLVGEKDGFRTVNYGGLN